MRVLVAPDKFAGTLSAPEAAEAMARGWRSWAPGTQLDLAPMSDGGPGFVEVLHQALGGELHVVPVPGPWGESWSEPGAQDTPPPEGRVPATVLVADDTAYVEAAQACGLHLVPESARDPERASSFGLGAAIAAALDLGVRRVVVGLGGTGTNDAGAGLLAALGAQSTPHGALAAGPRGLEGLEAVDLGPALARCDGVEIVAATDVDNPLLGLTGATNVYGPQKGLPAERLPAVDAVLAAFASATSKSLARTPGAGAGGGIGFALLLLGGVRHPGVELVAEVVDLSARTSRADLVLTGEGALDFSSRSGKVPYGVAQVAMSCARPCIVLAGEVLIGAREMRTLGIESGYAVADLVGREAAFADPAGSLARLAARVARSWDRASAAE